VGTGDAPSVGEFVGGLDGFGASPPQERTPKSIRRIAKIPRITYSILWRLPGTSGSRRRIIRERGFSATARSAPGYFMQISHTASGPLPTR
jgi:hypothetical protein